MSSPAYANARPIPALFPRAFSTPSGSIVSSPEFSGTPLIEVLIRSRPDLTSTALAINPALPLAIWKKLYTFRPKVSLDTALALTMNPLSPQQLEHMKRERRQSVWAQVRTHTYLSEKFVRDLSTSGSFNPHLPAPRMGALADRPLLASRTQILEEAAKTLKPWQALGTSSLRGASVNYLKVNLDSLGSWQVLFGLIDNFQGSLSELVGVCNALDEE